MSSQYKLEFEMRGSGFKVNEEAGEALGNHKLVYRGADSLWYLADADAAATMPVLGITMGAIPANRKGEILLWGYIGDTSWTWTAGLEIYASTTPGELTHTAPSGAGDIVQVVAVAITATIIDFRNDITSAGAGSCALLEGATAYVGIDACKAPFTNYFLSDGSDDAIQDAIDYMDTNNYEGTLIIERATYNIADLSIDTPVKIIGELGTVFNLTAQSCLTITADATKVFIEEIEFVTTVDTYSQIQIANPELKFEHCKFDFQVDFNAELQGVMRTNASSPNRIEYINSELIAGKTGANYFGFLKIANDMDALILRDFFISSLIVDAAAPNRVSLFELDTGQNIELVEFKNIDVDGYYCPQVVGAAFFGVHGTVDHIMIDNYIFRGGTWDNGVNVYHSPLQMFNVATYVEISNMELHERFHPVVQAQNLLVDNLVAIGDGGAAMFDCGATAATGCTANFNNVRGKDFSIDFNTGWSNLVVNNFTLDDCRIAILDEGTPTGQEKNVQIGDGVINSNSGGKYAGAILISYGQDVNLATLQITNVLWNRVDGNMVCIQPSGAATDPTLWILDNVRIKNVDYSWPRWIDGTARNNDNQVIWIFDSEITTYTPPLEDWNPIRDNDRFDNVKWIKTTDSSIYYSETCGKATIPNGSATVAVTHGLVDAPDYDPANSHFGTVLVTGEGAAHAELYEVCVNTIGAATFVIEHVGGNVTADRTYFWRAHVTGFAG